ncbi:transcription repressor OFP13-like [Papaver somniferum]|uniref:transcription repressor OFP13-like n=1 Tax=Papaver somniferum TaxID=3469 RepID=UPI000E6FEA14|nr:transcription repressor OFP13-like [Papaver somniferum]
MVMKLPSLFKNRDSSTTTTATTTSGSTYSTTSSSTNTAYSWQWPSCKHPKTNSFRGAHSHKGADDIFKTVNSVYFDASSTGAGAHDNNTLEAWFTNSSESGSFSTISQDHHHHNGEESFEMVIRGLRSERLFFEPSTDTNSILKESEKISVSNDEDLRFKESVVMAMDSEDPYVDFRTSMEEMVEAHGLKDWDCLEELLSWYLKVNGKKNHGYIVSAFVDLLVSIAAKSSNDQSKNKSVSSPTCSSSSSDETSCSGGTSLSPSFSSLLLQDPDEDSSSVSVTIDDDQKTSKLSCSEISEI